MKRLLACLLASVALLSAPTLFGPVEAAEPPVLFLTPHQDDETLFMGHEIKRLTESGRRVHVYLLTDGGASGVCTRWFESRAECVQARDAEFRWAVSELGARSIIRGDRARDGELTIRYARKVVNQLHRKFPNSPIRTTSWLERHYDGGHPDHANLGIALRRAGLSGSKWAIKRPIWAQVDQDRGPVGRYVGGQDLEKALLAYQPVGWLSVRSLFEQRYAGSPDRWH